MARVVSTAMPILVAKAATGVGTAQNVAPFDLVLLRVSAAVNSSLTYKIQGSVMDTCPAFGSAQAEANHWDYVATYDANAGSATLIPGDTGVAINNATVAANCILLAIDTRFLKWINADVTAYTDGDVTITAFGAGHD